MRRRQLEALFTEYQQSQKEAAKQMNEYRLLLEFNRKLIARVERQKKQIKKLKAQLDV